MSKARSKSYIASHVAFLCVCVHQHHHHHHTHTHTHTSSWCAAVLAALPTTSCRGGGRVARRPSPLCVCACTSIINTHTRRQHQPVAPPDAVRPQHYTSAERGTHSDSTSPSPRLLRRAHSTARALSVARTATAQPHQPPRRRCGTQTMHAHAPATTPLFESAACGGGSPTHCSRNAALSLVSHPPPHTHKHTHTRSFTNHSLLSAHMVAALFSPVSALTMCVRLCAPKSGAVRRKQCRCGWVCTRAQQRRSALARQLWQ